MHNATRAVQTMSATLDALTALSAPTRWQTVMFDPLAYIHPARLDLPATFDSPAQRAAINRLLIARYRLALPPLLQPVERQSDAEKLVLKHWLHLPQIVFLLGCQRLRLALARRGGLLRLPASARAFVTLPLLPPALQSKMDEMDEMGERRMAAENIRAAVATAPDQATLLRQGMRQLEISLGSLPALLAQRLPLLFAPTLDDGATNADAQAVVPAIEDARNPAHALTLRMAIQHVKRYPISAE